MTEPIKPKAPRKSRAKKADTHSIRDMNMQNLTKTRAKLLKAATRVNAEQPLDHMSYVSPVANHSTKGKTTYIPREREAGEATVPASDLFHRDNYRTGDGDYTYHTRAGSDHSHLKSLGFPT